MFTTICFRDDFSDFEGFLMPSIGRYTEEGSDSITSSGLASLPRFLGCRRNWLCKFSMQRKKKIHLLRNMKWVNRVLAMQFWWLIEKLCLPHFTVFIIFIEIPDDAQIDVEIYTLSNLFNQLFLIIWL